MICYSPGRPRKRGGRVQQQKQNPGRAQRQKQNPARAQTANTAPRWGAPKQCRGKKSTASLKDSDESYNQRLSSDVVAVSIFASKCIVTEGSQHGHLMCGPTSEQLCHLPCSLYPCTTRLLRRYIASCMIWLYQ